MTGTLFYSSMMTETSSFTNLPTTYSDFEASLKRGDDCIYGADGAPQPGAQPLLDFASARGWSIAGGISCYSSVGSPTLHSDYVRLRDEMLEALQAARPNVVVLMLHGAMMSTKCDDCEGDTLERARQIVGPNVPIVVVLDPHAHLTAKMVGNASLLIFMKEYPHTDGPERLVEALAIAGRMIDEGVQPRAEVFDCRLIGFFPTQNQPMRGFVDRLHDIEGRAGILSVSFVHGFPWGDMPDMGAKILVYTDSSNDPEGALGTRAAREIHEHIWTIKDETLPPMISIDEAIAMTRADRSLPLVLADISDNPGGGAPSDSTFIVRALIEAGVRGAAVGLVYDPQAVKICHQVGEGASIILRVGGKTGPASGDPLDLEAEVVGIRTDAAMTFGEDWRFPMGDTAWIRANDIDIVLCSIRIQLYHPSGFTHIGIDPAKKRVLVVKSSNHFQAFFEPLASEIAWVGTPGAIDFEFRRLDYRRIDRPMYPLTPDPFAEVAA